MDITTNPIFAAAPDAQHSGRTDLEAAVALLKAKDGNEIETVEALERLLIAREAGLRAEFAATLEAKLSAASSFSTVVRSAVAHLTEAPPNFHQATVMYAAGYGSGEMGDRALLPVGALVLSTCMVLMQTIVAAGVVSGTFTPVCASSDQCAQKGTWCDVGGRDRCMYCGTELPTGEHRLVVAWSWTEAGHLFNLTFVSDICSAPTDYGYYGADVVTLTSWCQSCVMSDGHVDTLTKPALAQANIAAMLPSEWIALIFATAVVALAVCGELKDIELCTMALCHAGDRVTPAWRLTLSLLGLIRRWCFLPTLISAVPILVMSKGGDALSICFNTVALLFLCEIDNMFYAILMPERARVQAMLEGRMDLGESEVATLMRIKVVNVVMVMVTVPSILRSFSAGGSVIFVWRVMRMTCLAFWVAGVTEAILGSGSVREACQEVGKVTGSFLLGWSVWAVQEVMLQQLW